MSFVSNEYTRRMRGCLSASHFVSKMTNACKMEIRLLLGLCISYCHYLLAVPPSPQQFSPPPLWWVSSSEKQNKTLTTTKPLHWLLPTLLHAFVKEHPTLARKHKEIKALKRTWESLSPKKLQVSEPAKALSRDVRMGQSWALAPQCQLGIAHTLIRRRLQCLTGRLKAQGSTDRASLVRKTRWN